MGLEELAAGRHHSPVSSFWWHWGQSYTLTEARRGRVFPGSGTVRQQAGVPRRSPRRPGRLRIEFPGACCYVIQRGSFRSRAFREERDREIRLEKRADNVKV